MQKPFEKKKLPKKILFHENSVFGIASAVEVNLFVLKLAILARFI